MICWPDRRSQESEAGQHTHGLDALPPANTAGAGFNGAGQKGVGPVGAEYIPGNAGRVHGSVGRRADGGRADGRKRKSGSAVPDGKSPAAIEKK